MRSILQKYLVKEKEKESGKTNKSAPKELPPIQGTLPSRNKGLQVSKEKVKSPSDTTLYAPALQKDQVRTRTRENPYLPRNLPIFTHLLSSLIIPVK